MGSLGSPTTLTIDPRLVDSRRVGINIAGMADQHIWNEADGIPGGATQVSPIVWVGDSQWHVLPAGSYIRIKPELKAFPNLNYYYPPMVTTSST